MCGNSVLCQGWWGVVLKGSVKCGLLMVGKELWSTKNFEKTCSFFVVSRFLSTCLYYVKLSILCEPFQPTTKSFLEVVKMLLSTLASNLIVRVNKD